MASTNFELTRTTILESLASVMSQKKRRNVSANPTQTDCLGRKKSLVASQWRRYFLSGLALACFATSTQGDPIDSTLFTTYTLGSNNTSVYWLVCGSTTESDGCYGDGTMGPFGEVGALLEGSPSYDDTTGTVTRAIYVVDVASGNNSAGVDLYVYKKTDVIFSTNDNVTVLLKDTITLPLKGGINALTFMAANGDYFLSVRTGRLTQFWWRRRGLQSLRHRASLRRSMCLPLRLIRMDL